MPPGMFEVARQWQRHCYEHGFAGIDWPVEYGGRGLSGDHALAWSEECARAGVTAYMNFQGIVLAGGAIKKFGTDEQRERYLDATLRADIVWCQLFSEPGAGSDLASLTTRAEPTGAGWLVTGQKLWSSTAQLAQHAILLARTDHEEPGHRGISFFLFDMNGPGVDVRPIRQMTGDAEFCEVFLDEAPVAADDLLGPLHGGWTVATSVLADERAEVGAAGIGLRRRLAGVDDARIVAEGQALAHLLGRSGGDPTLGPLTKLAMTELDGRITRAAVAAGGAEGMLVGPVDRAVPVFARHAGRRRHQRDPAQPDRRASPRPAERAEGERDERRDPRPLDRDGDHHARSVGSHPNRFPTTTCPPSCGTPRGRRLARTGSPLGSSCSATVRPLAPRNRCSARGSVPAGRRRSTDAGYDEGSALDPTSAKGRQRAAMQYFVDNFETFPVIVLACLVRYREPSPSEGSSVYPACQNLLLAARALGYGGVLTGWHASVEPELRELVGIPDGVAIAATIPLGRPLGSHGPVRRLPLRQVIYDDRWGTEADWAVDPDGTRFAGPPPGEAPLGTSN